MKRAPINADVLGLKLWYEDGSCIRIPFWDIQVGWRAAPRNGIQVIGIYDRLRRDFGYDAQWFAGYDKYALTTEELIETNRPGDIPEGADIKFGTEIDKDDFRKLYNSAMQDHEF